MISHGSPLYFLHIHKCGGTTFIKAASENGCRFALPGNAGLPHVSEDWTAVVHPFWPGGKIWEFWKEPDRESVAGKIKRMLGAGVTCIAQEYGPYDPRLWRDFVRVMCIRHPIDRLYSDFLHTQELGKKIAAGISFQDWVQSGSTVLSTTLYVAQLGQGERERARVALEDFHVIVVQEQYAETLAQMERYGWTSTDPEKHFKSWTARRTMTGRQALAGRPDILRGLEKRCAADLQIYERAVELTLGKADTPAKPIPA
jgi:hypothetical protein